MRFTLVSVALLALAHSVAPGVHGAPALASDHVNALAVPQDLVSTISSLLNSVLTQVTSILGSQSVVSPQTIQQIVQQAVQELQGSGGPRLRALPSSNATSPASLTTRSSTTTTATSLGLATNTASNASSVSLSTPQASSKPPTRMRRQLPTSLPAVPSIVPTQSALQPVESVLASVLSAVHSKLDSVTSQSTPSKPTGSKPSSSAS